jgi:hypothetical protein
MSHVTGRNSFTSQYVLNLYIYYRFCRIFIMCRKKFGVLNLTFIYTTNISNMEM